MLKIWTQTVFALLFIAVSSQAGAAPPIPAAPQIAASGHLLFEMQSGRVLAEHNADERLEPASLTKIMTAYVVFNELHEGHIALDDEVLVSKKAWQTPGSRMFIEVDTRVPVGELIKGMVIQSGNDASVALAEHVAGSEETFAALMNEHAARLGMTSSHFMNATGLPHEQHYTTARDIAKVTEATIHEFPEQYKLYAIKEMTYNEIRQRNRNRLLWWDESVDGVKTGHTEAAGYCLVSSAQKEGMRLVAVVMGTASENAREQESRELLNYGFRFFETHRLYGAGETLIDARVFMGESDGLPLGLSQDLFVTIPRKQYDKLAANMALNHPIQAPIAKGQPQGRLEVTFDGEPFTEVPLVALKDIPKGGLFDQAMDSVLLMFE